MLSSPLNLEQADVVLRTPFGVERRADYLNKPQDVNEDKYDQSYGDEGGREWLKGRQEQKTDGAEQH